MLDRMTIITSVVDLEPITFWENPLGYISNGVAQGIWQFFVNSFDNAVEFAASTSDTFTLFAVVFLIMAQLFGFDLSKRYRGLVIVSWLFIQGFAAYRGI